MEFVNAINIITAKSNEGWKCALLLTLLRTRASLVYYLIEQKEND